MLPLIYFKYNCIHHFIHLMMSGGKMEVAVMTGFFAKRNMYINAGHLIVYIWADLKMTKLIYRLAFVLLMIGAVLSAKSQHRLQYHITPQQISAPHLITDFATAAEAFAYLKKLPALLVAGGYISAAIDSVQHHSGYSDVYVFAGEKYRWRNLNTDSGFRSASQLQPVSRNVVVNPYYLQQRFNDVLDFYSNNGYPFASIQLENVTIDSNEVSANIHTNPGPYYLFDSIKLSGDVKLSGAFLYKHLGLEKGSAYNQSLINQIDEKLKKLGFVEVAQPSTISMYNSGAVVNIFLQTKSTNQVNAIIGFMPANPQQGGELRVTGEALLNLTNAFAGAENILVNWKQLQEKSPALILGYRQPYFLGTAVGISFNFDLYKRDTTYLNTNIAAGIFYKAGLHQNIEVFFQNFSTRLLEIDTLAIKSTAKLPDVLDMSAFNLGVHYLFNNTNYYLNPRSGWDIDVRVSAGTKTIRKNNLITSLKGSNNLFSSIYDSLQLKSYQLKSVVQISRYFPVGRQSTIKTVLQAGALFTNTYLRNELFQMGGYRLLRGFAEGSIFADKYAVGSLEYRYLVQKNAFFHVFSDVGVSHYDVGAVRQFDYYFSGGAGLSMELNNIILNIAYAVGKQSSSKFDFRQSKIHLGFVALF